MEVESERLASYNSKVLVTGWCLDIVKEVGQFCFTEWFVTLSSLKPGGAALKLLSVGGMWSVSASSKREAALPMRRDLFLIGFST